MNNSALGNGDKALELIRHGETTYQRLSEVQPSMKTVHGGDMNPLGIHYNESGKYKQAEASYLKALALYEGTEKKHQIGSITHNLAGNYMRMKETSKAIEYEEQALAMHIELYGDDNSNLGKARIMRNLGTCYIDLQQYEKSKAYLTCSLSSYQDCYGQFANHVDIAIAIKKLSVAHLYLNELEQAKDTCSQAMNMYLSIDPQHPGISDLQTYHDALFADDTPSVHTNALKRVQNLRTLL